MLNDKSKTKLKSVHYIRTNNQPLDSVAFSLEHIQGTRHLLDSYLSQYRSKRKTLELSFKVQ